MKLLQKQSSPAGNTWLQLHDELEIRVGKWR